MGTNQSVVIGEQITLHRKMRRMSQRELAKQAGLSRSYVCDIEKGRPTAQSLTTLEKIATALGVTVSEILNEGESEGELDIATQVDELITDLVLLLDRAQKIKGLLTVSQEAS